MLVGRALRQLSPFCAEFSTLSLRGAYVVGRALPEDDGPSLGLQEQFFPFVDHKRTMEGLPGGSAGMEGLGDGWKCAVWCGYVRRILPHLTSAHVHCGRVRACVCAAVADPRVEQLLYYRQQLALLQRVKNPGADVAALRLNIREAIQLLEEDLQPAKKPAGPGGFRERCEGKCDGCRGGRKSWVQSVLSRRGAAGMRRHAPTV